MAVEQSIKMGVDTSAADRELSDLAKSLNDFLRTKAQAANKPARLLDLSADKAQLQELQKQFEELLAMSKRPGGLGQIVGMANGVNRPRVPSQINLPGVSADPKEQAALMERVLGRLLTHHLSNSKNPINTGLTVQDLTGRAPGAIPPSPHPPPTPNPAQRPPAKPQHPDSPSGLGVAVQYLGQHMVQGAGGGASAGLAGLARGMAGSLPGGLLGGGLLGLAGYGLLKGAGAASDGRDRAEAEAIAVDRFKRTLGDLGVDFDSLRDHIREATEGTSLSFEQAGKMAEQFAKTADTRSRDVAELGGETANAAALARATGTDPEAMARFFGDMRAVKATGNVDDSRRMAVMVADAIKRSGSAINADRMLESLSAMSERVKDQSLGPVNVSGYAGMLSGLVGMGLKSGTASGLLGTLDASTRNPQSEVHDAFIFQALGGANLGHINAQRLRQAGLMASTASVFGNTSSPFYKPGMKTDGTTNLQKIMGLLNLSFPGQGAESVDMREASLASFLGGNHAHAKMFSDVYAQHGSAGLTRTSDMLNQLGVDPTSVNVAGLSQLAEIAHTQDLAGLQAQRQNLLGRKDLTPGQTDQLKAAADESNPNNLRRVLVEVAKNLGTQENQGQRLADLTAKMQNDTQTLATKLLPVSEMSRDFLGALVDTLASDSPIAKARKAESENAAILGATTPAQFEDVRNIVSARNEHLLPGIFAAEQRHGLRRGELAGLIERESQFQHNLYGKGVDKNGKAYTSQAYGLAQMTPAAVSDATPTFQATYKRSPNTQDPFDQMKLGAIYKSIMNRAAKGDPLLANKMYFAGPVGATQSSDKVSAAQQNEYARDVRAREARYAQSLVGLNVPPLGASRAVQLPAGNPAQQAATAAAASVNVAGSAQILVRLLDNDTERAAASATVPLAQRAGKPQAQGALPGWARP